MLSFWERQSFINFDHIIIGGGIVGLSTAVAIKEKFPNQSVAILERGTFPTGASTKNAGFACFGSLTEIMNDLKGMTETEVQELVEFRWKGLELLRSRLGDNHIGFKNYGGYELLFQKDLLALDAVEKVNQLLRPLFNRKVYSERSDLIKTFGFSSSHIKALIENPMEAQIDTGKMMKSLEGLAQQLGIKLFTNCEVLSFEETPEGVTVNTPELSFNARKLAVCSNAFTRKLLPETELKPGRGVVLVTKPIAGLPFKGTFHYEEGYYYFRNYEDRIIFGGGRNLDIGGEESTEFEVRELILDKLKSDLKTIILPNQKFEVDMAWAGIMAFGKTKQPIVQKHSENIVLGVRLGGMGVAVGSKVGQRLASLMLE
ncbi:FAD-dependent oxidoreductase [Roseivirga sp.]|uniref:NAD(P)/FAD-dependent oxidoreductase n=1 Tax=Roseivirga sp. TaxID=1964215 RepID=UPI002B276E51|nr:FAD-dependent oxidoreductase [Roseivirga sp.]